MAFPAGPGGWAVGIVFAAAGRLRVVLALTVSARRRITAIEVIADPDRLRRLRLAVLPDQTLCGT
jgi:RNA polymerase sigma-70 factor (ECF subfamily)